MSQDNYANGETLRFGLPMGRMQEGVLTLLAEAVIRVT